MSKTIGTPAQINALQSAFDELALLPLDWELCLDWKPTLLNVIEQLSENEFSPMSLKGNSPDIKWVMHRIVWLMREELRFRVKLCPYLVNQVFMPWWSECLTIALSIAQYPDHQGRKPDVWYLQERGFFAFLCLAEFRHYFHRIEEKKGHKSLIGIRKSLEWYPMRWYKGIAQYAVETIEKADSYIKMAGAKLSLAMLEEIPLMVSVQETFRYSVNALGLLRSVEDSWQNCCEYDSTRWPFPMAENDVPLFNMLDYEWDLFGKLVRMGENPFRGSRTSWIADMYNFPKSYR